MGKADFPGHIPRPLQWEAEIARPKGLVIHHLLFLILFWTTEREKGDEEQKCWAPHNPDYPETAAVTEQ